MAVFVNTNVSSLQGQRYLNNINNSLNTTYQRLSSGLRINSAKDDAAGLTIADRLTTQINGLNQGNRNASDGVALAQTIEGGLDEVSTMLQRMRTLAVQSSNGTNTAEDRDSMQKEVISLSNEINRIAEQTKFGGKTILNGNANDAIYKDAAQGDPLSAGSIRFQVGANAGDSIDLNVSAFNMEAIKAYVIATGGGNVTKTAFSTKSGTTFDVSTYSAAQATIKALDAAIKYVDTQRSDIGALQNRLESSIRNQSNVSANQADARSRIRDTDFAEESANLTQQNILQQAATSMLMQANMRPQLGLSLIG